MQPVVKWIIRNIVHIILFTLLLYLLWWRWQVATHRFFDIDEFSYLHWVSDYAIGHRPYTDFFLFISPGFLWAFAPIVKAVGENVSVFIAARIASYGIFLTVLALIGTLFAVTRSRKYALLPAVILAFLPMPFDKFVEIRPDNLATLLALAGLTAEAYALLLPLKRRPELLWIASGVFYALSLIVLVKTIPFVVAGLIIAIVARSQIRAFISGLTVPLMLCGIWFLVLGNIGKVWYSLTLLPFEVNVKSFSGIMEPHLFFFPNDHFYSGSRGAGPVTLGLITNHALWFIALIAGVIRFWTPYITANGQKRRVLAEILLGAVFVLTTVAYVEFYPLKHAQYLVPISLFIAYYGADAIAWGLTKVYLVFPTGEVILLAIFAVATCVATAQVNSVKIRWSNDVQVGQAKALWQAIPSQSAVLDLEGRVLFRKDAYYICCVPFGSFVGYMSHKPPHLLQVLEEEKTPYIFQGDSNRLTLLSDDDQSYIYAHYRPVSGWGERLFQRK